MHIYFGDEERPNFVKKKKNLIDFNFVNEEDLLVIQNYQKWKKKNERCSQVDFVEYNMDLTSANPIVSYN